MKYRQDADCNPASIFTEADFSAFEEDARKLTGRVLEMLRKSGYSPSDPA